jgi:hypothetical protein
MGRFTRRRFLLVLAWGLGAGALWWQWYRPGEARCLGRPTSWWAAAAHRSEPRLVAFCSLGCAPVVLWVERPQPWEALLSRVGFRSPFQTPRLKDTLLRGDPAAAPVLLELLRRPEPNARLAAVVGLGALIDKTPAARPALEAATADLDNHVRLMAKRALGRLEGPRPRDWPDW